MVRVTCVTEAPASSSSMAQPICPLLIAYLLWLRVRLRVRLRVTVRVWVRVRVRVWGAGEWRGRTTAAPMEGR